MKIFVAGAGGLVGAALVRCLRAGNYTDLLTPPRQELDLTDQASVLQYLARERPDYIFMAAAKVGGVHANNVYRADFIYENLMVQSNLIHGAHLAGIQRLLFLGSSCIYPRDCPQPMKEEHLLSGPLEQTNEPYAIAKIAGIKMCDSYNRQHHRQYISAMPTNLYGPNDKYDLFNSHVLPALIRKVHLAKLALGGRVKEIEYDEARFGPIPAEVLAHLGLDRRADGAIEQRSGHATPPKLEVWGSGTPQREFLYVDDLARACVHLMQTGYDGPLINIGAGSDVSIKALARLVCDVIGFTGELAFDASKPDGTPRKWLDSSRIEALGWRPAIALHDGITLAYADYCARARAS